MRRAKVIIRILLFVIALIALIGQSNLFFRYEFMSVRHSDAFNMFRLLRGSLNLGSGNCKWQPPGYDIPNEEEESFYKSLIAGFPSGDKRLTFVQMEALTGLPAKDEWDFAYLGMTNHPFIKANYPHHEGIWGWGQQADQTIMVVRNIRRALTEYHDILWDIGYAKTWAEATDRLDNLYRSRPPIEDWFVWRDLRVMDEIKWYGWFIDYYMEGGLMRDMFTNKITTKQHWDMLMLPTAYTKAELDYDVVVGNQSVTPTYDPHCIYDMPAGCEPILIISVEKLVDTSDGPAEGLKIANIIDGKEGMEVIEEEARRCVWEELIIRRKGLKTYVDREGYGEYEYNFTEEQLQAMIDELSRVIIKYSSPVWSSKQTAQDLVTILTWHRGLIQDELDSIHGQ